MAIVSPCSPEVFWVEHRAQRGCAYLESLHLRVRIMPHTGASMTGMAVPGRGRADDINAAFADPEVSVILAAIGGNSSADLLPHLDFATIRANPKVFQGYSDVTVLHWAMRKFGGLCTFYGPALLPELGEYPSVLPYTDRALRQAWFGTGPVEFAPSDAWTDEFLDWTDGIDLTRARRLRPSAGWTTLRDGIASGPLVGGCLETIWSHLRGSEAWLDLEGVVLFLETSEVVPSPAEVEEYLRDLAEVSVFERISGLVVGRPYGYSAADVVELHAVILEATGSSGIPVLADVDVGHTDPMLTLPLGVDVRVDARSKSFRTLESATT